jgi:hypothetical protein
MNNRLTFSVSTGNPHVPGSTFTGILTADELLDRFPWMQGLVSDPDNLGYLSLVLCDGDTTTVIQSL